MKEYIENLCIKSRLASRYIANLTTNQRNDILMAIADKLRERSSFIIEENRKDLDIADTSGVNSAFRDRLLLNVDRIEGLAKSIEEIAALNDPVGRVEGIKVMPSGIRVGQMRVPIGVICVIYESRPNVTTDISALCIKSGNAAILRGGRESIHSNIALYTVIKEALAQKKCPEDIITLITKIEHEYVPVLLKMKDYIDIVIPRGGEKLIGMVSRESTIPVIKHDKGVCHIFVDASSKRELARNICINAKVQRPGVCNAMETLLIHRDYPDIKGLLESMIEEKVEIRGCAKTVMILPDRIKPASAYDWGYEFLDLILAVKIVDSMEEAMRHIAEYGSGHSEAILTEDYSQAERFLREVDSSAVFVNASTRFHDGGEFGLGAEVGISTQKLHARGTMGIEGLTCLKYIIYGSGQVRS